MFKKRALQTTLTLAGLIFMFLAYPMVVFFRQEPSMSMMFSLYATLGVFLLLAVRNPAQNRSLIGFTAWSSLAHAGIMGTQAMRNIVSRDELAGVGFLIVLGVALLILAPARQ